MTATSNSGGRNRKTKAQHKLNNTFRPDRHGVEVTVPEGVPECPESLTGQARVEWDRMIERLTATRPLAPSDGPCMLHYCELAALATRLQSELDELPSVQYPKLVAGGESVEPAVHPLVSQLVRVRSALRLYLTELGLTPASRDRVPATRLTVDDLAVAAKRKRFFGAS